MKGVAGTWKDLTDSVNFMASNLTGQVRNIADVTTAVANGDLSKKITVEVKGRDPGAQEHGQHHGGPAELLRGGGDAGGARGGHRRASSAGQADVRGRRGDVEGPDGQRELHGRVTSPSQVRNIADVTKAVAAGDLSKKITVEVKGEILELKNTVNTMVDQLSSFAAEVTRVAREVGTDGKLGGQADVRGRRGDVEGPHGQRELHGEQPDQPGPEYRRRHHRGRPGDLSKKITVDVKGEILELEEHGQHHGGPAPVIRGGGDAGGARGGHRAASSGARPTCATSRGRGRTSRTA